MKTWTNKDAGKETCPKCNSVYEVKITRFPLRDKDSFNCQVCGYEIESWNDTEVPSFTLVKRVEPIE
ncbi:hypothetical protein [Anabaena lutea]|uniref:Uncharacterized protein n=1 Tax=Anabaena lutea FACHB-196 TaxID=2692881 RepID=A0ABR8F929_9NOST|nr:hypothetical protein [Anabaena lutea]MBD2566705.1 hypothetical protein [Anabaena lutea FACHB-196]